MSTISIVIRTYNEEKWIRHCLNSVFSQDFKNYEVIIVDNNSTDKTLSIAKNFPIKKIVNIEKYLPGLALNLGVLANKSDYYVFLSAHCIPCEKDWLSNLHNQINQNNLIVGAYGRQVPLPSSEKIDKRDLLMTFSCESRISKLDGFFHNANSIVRGGYFDENLFDPNVTNAEDHLWGRNAIKAGFQLAYSSEAKVFHHHGLHQGSPPKRVSGVVKQLEKNLEDEDIKIPNSLTISGTLVYPIIIIPDYLGEKINSQINQFILLLSEIVCFKEIFFVIPEEIDLKFDRNAYSKKIHFLKRELFETSQDSDLRLLIQELLKYIEARFTIPDHILYLNASYKNSKSTLIDLINTHLSTNSSVTLVGQKTYQCIWAYKEIDGYQPVSLDLLKPRKMRKPLFKVFYGLGTIYLTCDLRVKDNSKQITGILEIDESQSIIRLN